MARSAGRENAGLVDDLRRAVRGRVFDDDAHRENESTDFGGLVRRTPALVVRPVDTADVASVVRYAAARRLSVTTRGAGLSQGGQSLSAGGVLLDTRCLSSVGPAVPGDDGGLIEVGAGARWTDVVRSAGRSGLVPPVLTNNPWATVGGTHSTGGIGTSSFRRGSQADNCLALEAVTGTGEVVRCDADDQPDLFRHALCGLGQLAVLTRVTHALRAHGRLVRTDVFVYDDVDALVEDLRRLTEEGGADYLDAAAVHHPRERSWLFPLRLSSEVDEPDRTAAHPAPRAARRLRHETIPFADFVRAREGRPVTRPGAGALHPWTDVFLPWDRAGAAIREAVRELPWEVACRYALRPLRPRRDRTPALALPDGTTCLGFGAYPVVPRAGATEVLAAVDRLRAVLVGCGGTSYLSGWGGSAATTWPEHHGAAWPQLRDAKRRFDPYDIFTTDHASSTTGATHA